MSILNHYRSELVRLKEKEASLRKSLNDHERDAARAREETRKKIDSAVRASSSSMRSSYLSSAEREQQKANNAEKRAADVSHALADNAKAQSDKARYLADAEKMERQTLEREEERRRRKEADHARDMTRARAAADREDERRRHKELVHAREVARLTKPTVKYVHVREPEPEKLRVLYLTSNPDMDLRTEAEVRSVQQSIRGSKYRDHIDIAQRPAATIQDLLDGINDVYPHIIHFSGHGGGQSLFFDNGDLGNPAGQNLDFGLLSRALGATDSPPTLLVLNACDTLDGVDVILPAVPVVVAMSDSIPDMSATLFVQQFYAAIASAQSVDSALRQAQFKMDATLLDGSGGLVRTATRDDIDLTKLVLVKSTF